MVIGEVLEDEIAFGRGADGAADGVTCCEKLRDEVEA